MWIRMNSIISKFVTESDPYDKGQIFDYDDNSNFEETKGEVVHWKDQVY